MGSVWIELILLILKTENWKYYNKIIFKCVNSAVGSIFNEKIAEKWNLWVCEQCTDHCLLQKIQPLWLLFNKQYINSSRIILKRVKTKKKKKKKRRRRNETWRLNVDAAKAQSKQTLGMHACRIILFYFLFYHEV